MLEQSNRLVCQHENSNGVNGIFGNEAKLHDITVGDTSLLVYDKLIEIYPQLTFQYQKSVTKSEINESMQKLDTCFGSTLFVEKSSIRPDGGVIEVKDDNGNWRIVLISEAKHQGNDIENIRNGKLVGKDNNQDLMSAGNAIERSYKNIAEFANYMLSESHFPYILFLAGSNFLTETITVERPDGRKVTLDHTSGALNRLDRLTAANYGMPINTNLCENKSIKNNTCMMQATSIYTHGNGDKWNVNQMFDIMIDVSQTSLRILGSDLFQQLTSNPSVS